MYIEIKMFSPGQKVIASNNSVSFELTVARVDMIGGRGLPLRPRVQLDNGSSWTPEGQPMLNQNKGFTLRPA